MFDVEQTNFDLGWISWKIKIYYLFCQGKGKHKINMTILFILVKV